MKIPRGARLLKTVVLSLTCLILSGCFLETYTVRYKLTLVVEVDGAVKIGSSVVEVKYIDQAPWIPQWATDIHGDATYVDLGTRGVLVSLLHGEPDKRCSPCNPAEVPLAYFPSFFREGGLPSNTAKGGRELTALMDAKPNTAIPLALLPLLVWFPDANSPAGGKFVDPSNVSATLGDKVKLLRATIEITDAPVTRTITKELSWLLPSLDNGTFSVGLPWGLESLQYSSFRWEGS
jgi:hypothetical protein